MVFLTFFTNIVLLACFLGMSAGLLAARRPREHVRSVLPFAALSMALAIGIFIAYSAGEHQLTITVGRHEPLARAYVGGGQSAARQRAGAHERFLSLGPAARTLASCALVFVPVFFAGVIFAAAFSVSAQPDVDFGWNVAGIILGGLSEQLSLITGFNHLLLLAVAYYALSLALRPRTTPA